jgi:hypothetical protein
MDVVKEKVDEGSSFILIDDSHWVTDKDFFGRTRIPFMEKHGYYAGPPESDSAAIKEIEKQKRWVPVISCCHGHAIGTSINSQNLPDISARISL